MKLEGLFSKFCSYGNGQAVVKSIHPITDSFDNVLCVIIQEGKKTTNNIFTLASEQTLIPHCGGVQIKSNISSLIEITTNICVDFTNGIIELSCLSPVNQTHAAIYLNDQLKIDRKPSVEKLDALQDIHNNHSVLFDTTLQQTLPIIRLGSALLVSYIPEQIKSRIREHVNKQKCPEEFLLESVCIIIDKHILKYAQDSNITSEYVPLLINPFLSSQQVLAQFSDRLSQGISTTEQIISLLKFLCAPEIPEAILQKAYNILETGMLMNSSTIKPAGEIFLSLYWALKEGLQVDSFK